MPVKIHNVRFHSCTLQKLAGKTHQMSPFSVCLLDTLDILHLSIRQPWHQRSGQQLLTMEQLSVPGANRWHKNILKPFEM